MAAAAVESQIDAFLAKYTPEIEATLRAARARLRAAFPRGVEMVFDNYNALVFGIGPTERSTDAFISIAGYPRWVTLFFLHGAALDDPAGVLEGTGSQVRGVRIARPETLDRPEVAALVAQAMAPHAGALDAAPPLRTVVKTVSARQRPRRPAEAKAPGPAGRVDVAPADAVKHPVSAGYSGTPLARKLGIGAGARVAALDPPPDYQALLAPLPEGVAFEARAGAGTDVAHLFVRERAALARHLETLRGRLRPDAVLWISWPKKTAKVPTTVTEDVIRQLALPLGFVDVKVCAVDATWSGLKLVVRKALR
jgi:hypothetical protein